MDAAVKIMCEVQSHGDMMLNQTQPMSVTKLKCGIHQVVGVVGNGQHVLMQLDARVQPGTFL